MVNYKKLLHAILIQNIILQGYLQYLNLFIFYSWKKMKYCTKKWNLTNLIIRNKNKIKIRNNILKEDNMKIFIYKIYKKKWFDLNKDCSVKKHWNY